MYYGIWLLLVFLFFLFVGGIVCWFVVLGGLFFLVFIVFYCILLEGHQNTSVNRCFGGYYGYFRP